MRSRHGHFTFKVNDGGRTAACGDGHDHHSGAEQEHHIASVTMSKQRVGLFANKWQARAIVKIVDQNNQSVSGVSVAGAWYGCGLGLPGRLTPGASGEVTFTSPRREAGEPSGSS
jgi:hypothetical protein